MNLAQSVRPNEKPVVKGQGGERVCAAPTSKSPNDILWAQAVVTNQACQDHADGKAFTGKGKHLELRRLLAELRSVEQYMSELVAASKAIAGHRMMLAVHRNTGSGVVTLRWRSSTGAMPHLSWVQAAAIASELPGEMSAWYQRATAHCITANDRHKAIRRAVALARKVISGSRPHLYPRPVASKGLTS